MAYTTINKPSNYFNTLLYTGNGTSGNSITGVGFQPDFTWIKVRTSADSHGLTDVVRTAGYTIFSDLDVVQQNPIDKIQSFDSDGFTLGTNGMMNGNGSNYVSWNWLTDNTSGSSNTDGSITSTVSANTTSGFSIVKYTGTGSVATIGHGLSSAPEVVLIKNLSTTNAWRMYSSRVGVDGQLSLNQASLADSGNTAMWNNTAPASSVFTVGTHPGVNESGSSHIAYCFHSVKGFSKTYSYQGNSNTDGTFVYTGFKPAWVLIKAIDQAQGWLLHDNKRIGYNPRNNIVTPHSTNAEYTSGFDIDFLSNGFKPRTTDGAYNQAGYNYFYLAFAEHPLVSSTGTPCTAR